MPTKSSFPEVNVSNLDIWEFLFERHDRKYPNDKSGLILPKSSYIEVRNTIDQSLTIGPVLFVDPDTGYQRSYHDIRDQSIRLGTELKAQHDWQRGDVLAIFSPNHIDYATVFLGTHWAGGTASLINPTYTVTELQFQLEDSRAKLLVMHSSLLPTVEIVAKRIGLRKDRIFLIDDGVSSTQTSYKHFRAICSPNPAAKPIVDPANDLAFLVYSSGTTGKPKGVMLTHRNMISNTLMLQEAHEGNLSWQGGADRKGDRQIGFLPFFHSYGLQAILLVDIFLGIETVVMPRFDLKKFCEITERLKITFVSAVPPVILALGKSPIVDKYDLSSIRMIGSGAAPLTKDLVDLVTHRLNVRVMQGYGLSETSPVTHQQRWGSSANAIGSIGPLLSNQTSKLVAPSGEEVPTGEVGELWIKGPNVFKGYLNNPEGTRSSFSQDGYFKTGDIGYQDDKGNVFITDRIKELIKYKGFQIAPAELEGLLMSHPEVADAAVVGVVDDQRATEVPRAYIVAMNGRSPNKNTAEEMMGWIEERVAPHKRLRGGIVFVDVIPKSAAGKILRNDLRKRAKEEDARHNRSRL